MKVDWNAEHKADREYWEKRDEQFNNDLAKLTEDKKKELESTQKMFESFILQEDRKRECEMLDRIEEEKRALENSIVREYEKENSSYWNECEATKELRKMAKKLFEK